MVGTIANPGPVVTQPLMLLFLSTANEKEINFTKFHGILSSVTLFECLSRNSEN